MTLRTILPLRRQLHLRAKTHKCTNSLLSPTQAIIPRSCRGKRNPIARTDRRPKPSVEDLHSPQPHQTLEPRLLRVEIPGALSCAATFGTSQERYPLTYFCDISPLS